MVREARSPDQDSNGAGTTDPEQGLYRGRRVARRAVSAEGFTILVGRTARDNDILTFKLAAPADFWLHVVGQPGSHVVVRNPDKASQLPRPTLEMAASLAAGYSKAASGGSVTVHVALRENVRKPRGVEPGKVEVRRGRTVRASPRRLDGEEDGER